MNDESRIAQEHDRIVEDWIRRNVGPVTAMERQGRWRPAWYVDVETGAGNRRLYVRGDRGESVRTQPQPLSFEYDVLRLFHRSGMRVPEILGYIDAIPAIVMERVSGVPDLRYAASESDRAAVRSQLVDQMVLMHGIDPAGMIAAGAPAPLDDRELILSYYSRVEKLYLATKNRPEPVIEFIRRWLDRHLPEAPRRPHPIAVDAGQFIFDGDRLTAMLDFEFATLGDYHTDLAALRLRNSYERIGDLNGIYREYSRRSGLAVDANRIRYHAAIIGTLPAMQMSENLGRPSAEMDYIQSASWNAAWLRIAIENIAEIEGWEAEPFLPPAEPNPSRYAVVIDAVQLTTEDDEADDELAAFKRGRNIRALRFLRRADASQPAVERAYMADVGKLVGKAPSNWHEADAMLEKYVRQATVSEDETLLRLLRRKLLCECFVLADAEDPGNHAMLTTALEPLQMDARGI